MRAPARQHQQRTPDGPTGGPPLRARLFGEMDLRADGDRPLGPVESARARSLLAYLLVRAEAPHARQHLAFLLWPDSTEGQARTNLRKALHTLRREAPAVERYLEVSPSTLQWRGDVRAWVDVEVFESALEEADRAEDASDAQVAALGTAVELYRGDLLEGCYDEWVLEHRARLRDRYVVALARLARLLLDRGDHAGAVRLAAELRRCDPLNEDSYRLLMSAHDAAGDRAAAVRTYHECVATLQRELAVGPSRATTKAYQALMRPDGAPFDVEGAAVALGGVSLVGRDRELGELIRCWREVEGGPARLVLLTGEAGIGKTRLVEELGVWCAGRGAVVAQARSYPAEGELGYGVIASWLRNPEVSAHLRSAARHDAGVLARLLPELGEAETEPDSLDEAGRRRQLYDAVARALAGPGRPVLLVADDAQWADPQSLQLVHFLVRGERRTPLMVVATVRGDDLGIGHPLGAAVDGLRVIDRATEIALDRLSPSDTAALAGHLVPPGATPPDAETLYLETEGNPLFVVETVRWGAAGKGSGPAGVAPKLQAVIAGRLRELSEQARALVGVAATVGRAFTAELVGVASGLDDVALLRGLDELWRRGVIREHGSDAYDFAHGKIRDVAYAELTPEQRRRGHLLVAQALRRLSEPNTNVVSGQVARHYELAGHLDDAVSWYREAAAEAQRLHAPVEAVRLLDRAGVLVAAMPDGRHRLTRELEVLSALPTVLAWSEGFSSTRLVEVQRRASDVAGLLGVKVEPLVLRSQVMSRLCGDDFPGARNLAARLRDAGRQARDRALDVEAGYLLGISEFWGGSLTSAEAHFRDVAARFGPEQRDEHLMRFGHDPGVVCLSRLANTLCLLGRVEEATQTADRALALAEEGGHPYSGGVARIFAALLALDLDDDERFLSQVTALAAGGRHGKPTAVKTAALVGLAEARTGHPGGVRRIRAALADCGPVNPAPAFRVSVMRLLVAAHDAGGDPRGGLEAADEALGLGGSRLWEAETRRLRARFLAATRGSDPDVRAELDRAEGVALRQGAGWLQHRVRRTRLDLGLA